MKAEDPLITYLATHDAPCPGCAQNLRGQVDSTCPACLKKLYYGEVATLHAAFGDAKSGPMPVPTKPFHERLVDYLSENHARCPGCERNLRGQTGTHCPACDHALDLGEVVRVHSQKGDAWTPPMPVPGEYEPAELAEYLADRDTQCPQCGYRLEGLQRDACPECGRKLRLAEFVVPVPDKGSRAHVEAVTAMTATPIGLLTLVAAINAAGPTSFRWRVMFIFLALCSIVLGYVIIMPARRMMLRDMRWMFLFNPATAILSLYAIVWALYLIVRQF